MGGGKKSDDQTDLVITLIYTHENPVKVKSLGERKKKKPIRHRVRTNLQCRRNARALMQALLLLLLLPQQRKSKLQLLALFLLPLFLSKLNGAIHEERTAARPINSKKRLLLLSHRQLSRSLLTSHAVVHLKLSKKVCIRENETTRMNILQINNRKRDRRERCWCMKCTLSCEHQIRAWFVVTVLGGSDGRMCDLHTHPLSREIVLILISFFVCYSTSVPGAPPVVIWTGVKKGPPRALKFVAHDVAVSLVKASLPK
jgi:hypothetical protein